MRAVHPADSGQSECQGLHALQVGASAQTLQHHQAPLLPIDFPEP